MRSLLWWEGDVDTWREKTVDGADIQMPLKQLLCAMPGSFRGQENTRALGLGVSLEVAMRKGHSLLKIEGDAEVILTDAVIATILLKGKLQKIEYDKTLMKRDNKMM